MMLESEVVSPDTGIDVGCDLMEELEIWRSFFNVSFLKYIIKFSCSLCIISRGCKELSIDGSQE